MECPTCSCQNSTSKIVYACGGCADVGEVADQVSRKLRKDGFATPKASCLAGIGAGMALFIDAAKTADQVITIDGCEVGCAKKIIENIGLQPHSIYLTSMGLEKGKTVPSVELTSKLCESITAQF